MKRLIYLLFIFLNFSCVNNQLPENRILELIKSNKKNLLFLNFWAGMNDVEFSNIESYETKLGNLQNGNYILFLNNSKEIEFKVINGFKSIKLQYKDESWSYWENKNRPPAFYPDGYIEAMNYQEVKDSILNIFDRKYTKIKDERTKHIWKNDNKVIMVNYQIMCFGSSYYNEHILGLSEYATVFAKRDKKKKRDLQSSINLTITYELYKDYESEINSIKLEKEREKKEILKEKELRENIMKKTKNQL